MRPPPLTFRLAALALLLACLLVGAACAPGRGAPVFGQQGQPPTRTIAGERVALEDYGGAWAPVAEASAGDRGTMNSIWAVLEKAGIPATVVSMSGWQRVKVPGPRASQARALLGRARGDGSSPTHRYTVLYR